MAPKKKSTDSESITNPEDGFSKGLSKRKANKSGAGKKQANKKTILNNAVSELQNTEPGMKKEPIPEIKTQEADNTQTNRSALILGGGLVLIGIILIFGRFLNIPFGSYLWPFIFIIPGTLIFMSALVSENSSGEGLTILGGILMMLGLVFLAQQITGLWASWAYVWALIAPTSIGFSQIIYGTRKGRDLIIKSGKRLVNIGLYIFIIGFVFFELVLNMEHLGGESFDRLRLPIGLIVIGAFILFRALGNNKYIEK